MPYTLVGSLRSPFVRICRMFMIRQNIPFEFKVLNFVDDEKDAVELAKITPINKVPLLIDGDQKIYDSRVIIDFLSRKTGLPARCIEEENRISVIYSCLDTSVILFLMKRDGFDVENTPGYFLSRQRARLPSNFEYIIPWVKTLNPENPKHWSYDSMSLYSYLYWAQARNLLEIKDYPVFAEFMAKFANATGVKETNF